MNKLMKLVAMTSVTVILLVVSGCDDSSIVWDFSDGSAQTQTSK